MRRDGRAIVAKTPYASRAEVGVKVHPLELPYALAAVYIPSGDGAAEAVAILRYRGLQIVPCARWGAETTGSLHHVPSVVHARVDDVHLLKGVLTDVTHPKVAGLTVEGEPPRVAKPVGPHLAASARLPNERVVGRYCVWGALRRLFRVDSEDCAQERSGVLPISGRVPGRTAVTQPDV